MKEKRYFCDFMRSNSSKKEDIIVVISLIVFIVLTSVISYNLLSTKHGNELKAYSESDYKYLEEVADSVIEEGVGINISALPSNVCRYEITYEYNEVTFTYYLDNNKGMVFAESASMTVKLSDKYEIISKSSNYSSQDDFIHDTKVRIGFVSGAIGVLMGLVIYLLFLAICGVVYNISKVRKKNNEKMSS